MDPWKFHPEDASRIFAELGQLFEHGKHTHEYRWRAADGPRRWIYDQLVLARDVEGHPVEVAGSSTDITARKETEEELRHAKSMSRRRSRGAWSR